MAKYAVFPTSDPSLPWKVLSTGDRSYRTYHATAQAAQAQADALNNPTPTSTDVVPVAELRALLSDWSRYRDEQRTRFGSSPDVPGYVAGIYHCGEALADLLTRYTPEGE